VPGAPVGIISNQSTITGGGIRRCPLADQRQETSSQRECNHGRHRNLRFLGQFESVVS